MNPLLKRYNGDSGSAGRRAEKRLAKRLAGDLRPGSGALAGAKGDVSLPTFLIESKSSKSDSFSIRLDHLLKIYQEALEVSKSPALAFSFVNAQGESARRGRWVCIPEHVFQELIEVRE